MTSTTNWALFQSSPNRGKVSDAKNTLILTAVDFTFQSSQNRGGVSDEITADEIVCEVAFQSSPKRGRVSDGTGSHCINCRRVSVLSKNEEGSRTSLNSTSQTFMHSCFSPLKVEEGARAHTCTFRLWENEDVSVLSESRKGPEPTPKICHVDQGVARPFAFCRVCDRYLTGVHIRMSFEIEVFRQ